MEFYNIDEFTSRPELEKEIEYLLYECKKTEEEMTDIVNDFNKTESEEIKYSLSKTLFLLCKRYKYLCDTLVKVDRILKYDTETVRYIFNWKRG